ncbi:TIGR00297 family protein [Prochlorococcus sp. MIT 1223]|uniref:TIGR00297 family protein n=1 Tax=Prochlorococcus sp. MIT 1223 TaxID=3096217 RepID=UPI002A747ED0|nr:TIGR00297 family protein [Prochlorococcus sp. MIT 1223]
MISFTLIDTQWLIAFILNFILIFIGQGTKLLTPKGWFHAGILGTLLWGCLGWEGWCSVVVYLVLGTYVTKIGFKYKESLGIAEGRGGRRGPENVWGSAATGAFIAILINLGVKPESILLLAFSASFSAKLADTFGSEIGKRWGKKTFLISSFQPVPAGTEGAISLEGTIASFLGSILMTSVMRAFSLITSPSFVLISIFSGFISTLFESVLGAVVQNKFKWLSNEIINCIQTSFAACLAVFLVYVFS